MMVLASTPMRHAAASDSDPAVTGTTMVIGFAG